jgi:hypothetical protein
MLPDPLRPKATSSCAEPSIWAIPDGAGPILRHYTENAYLGNGSANRVAEMDGRSGQTTGMQQVVTIQNPMGPI